ncbi:hypothetical protein [Novosphingobium sp. RL4]|uniref:hypothetical protein n=1 Tax=Novosphingobium sp. RL4 TaxID=3109595 RepID=UPI002D7887AF|nr:hypothetical protein [Novosphingobium sp. RL4]WRT91723.1 hypothetical protein U9J33_10875 [Novosphingobium sp. RL4]
MESGLIVAIEVIDAGNDIHHLVPMVEATQKNTGALPQMSLADRIYDIDFTLQNNRWSMPED